MLLRSNVGTTMTHGGANMEMLLGVAFACIATWVLAHIVGGPKVDLDE